MALSKRTEAFRKKVLEKLFPVPVPPGVISTSTETTVLRSSGSEQEDPESSTALQGYSTVTGKKNVVLPPRKMYTVNPPPKDYVPATNNETRSDNAESEDGSAADVPEESYQGQPQRKRIRRKKQKNVLQNPDNLHGSQAEYGKHENLIEDNFQLRHTDGPNLSRNKKRKMKKKRQKEKMRAAGLLTKPAGIDFTYKPEREGGFEDTDKKVNDILDFLQATQEIYFSEKQSKCADSHSESIHEILQSIESHSMSSTDVTLLHEMTSLVLLKDVEKLKGAVEEFHTRSVLPLDHAKAIAFLFLYWITDILPGKNRKQAECAHPSVQS
ncbi:glutamate-rich protein 1 [Rhineura floridana]|uniref:glutamate-rich protein 1 n=1 Tax=Rhineura floridana TaxID=261503 RepID=UPI002AC80EE7|nr:glutamate-rich protein 1 [Rhineura floridana]